MSLLIALIITKLLTRIFERAIISEIIHTYTITNTIGQITKYSHGSTSFSITAP